MSIEPIGLITILALAISVIFGLKGQTALLINMSLLGSASAMIIGSTSVSPAQFILIGLTANSLSRQANSYVSLPNACDSHSPHSGWFALSATAS